LFQGGQPRASVEITPQLLQNTYLNMSTTRDSKIDLVAVGCPHYSLVEFTRLVGLIHDALQAGKSCHPDVIFLVTTSREMLAAAEKAGYIESLKAFGIKIVTDTCILATPILPPSTKHIMTNSGKYAYYAPGMLNVEVTYGGLEDCVNTAITGRDVREVFIWD